MQCYKRGISQADGKIKYLKSVIKFGISLDSVFFFSFHTKVHTIQGLEVTEGRRLLLKWL